MADFEYLYLEPLVIGEWTTVIGTTLEVMAHPLDATNQLRIRWKPDYIGKHRRDDEADEVRSR